MKNINVAVVFIVLFLAINQLSFSQTDTSGNKSRVEIIKISVNKLQQKILLSNKQTPEIEQILSGYTDKYSIQKNKTLIIDKVEDLLNTRQKDKFEIIKNDWWDGFIKLLNAR